MLNLDTLGSLDTDSFGVIFLILSRTRWCQFDFAMLALIAASVVMHTFELFDIHHTAFNLARSPRPFIMIRFIRSSFKFSMPKARLNQIFKRSSQQIYNVTLFFVFFWVLYGLLGVQFFGDLHSHCVRYFSEVNQKTFSTLISPEITPTSLVQMMSLSMTSPSLTPTAAAKVTPATRMVSGAGMGSGA